MGMKKVVASGKGGANMN
ncbi:BgTH12-06969 [Blumeria graminis f. sp. triticale]|uniref:Bgt-51642 n=2 Tax=Blumeria graminis TaxID=34373 RepID=A0A9X9MNT7_BLUGR|nr:BgTH12-06969 [Blumeria graminis f. sp. triticale]VDB94685.1 Bgt-51642 [Blumeria graminis f. sp. tritici]